MQKLTAQNNLTESLKMTNVPNNMKNVLVLTGRYKPNMSANSVCINNIIELLPRDKYSVTCICYEDYQKTEDENVTVYKVSRGHIKSFIYKHEKEQNFFLKILLKALKLVDKLLLLCHTPIWPWTDILYTKNVYKLADKLHKKICFNYVISVHMPLSSLIVGKKLKEKYPEICFVPYFLDSLSGGRPLSFFSDKWNLKKKLKWERKILPYADKIVVMEASRTHNEKYNSNWDYYKKFIYLDIPLLTQVKEIGRVNNVFNNGKINVVYTGTANYPMRNIIYFINVVNEISKLSENKIVFHIIGQSNCESLFNCPDIKYHLPVAHERLTEYLNSADIFINFGVKTPSAISGKIFEYMSYGKPIISTYSIENEACIPYLKKYPLALMVDENIEDYKFQAENIIKFIYNSIDKKVDVIEIRDIFKKNMPETFIDYVFDSTKL